MALSCNASLTMTRIFSAVRAIGTSTVKGNNINYTFGQSRSFLSSSSIPVSKDLVNATLDKVLECEIKSAKSNLKISQMNKSARSSGPFPYVFRVIEPSRLILKRKFPDCESVEVYINRSKIEWSNDDDSCAAIPMSVTFSKPGKDKDLNFHITFSKEDIIIQDFHIHYYPYGYRNGPKIKKLDHELQQCLFKYLEIRGITKLAGFLLKHMSEIEKETNVALLRHLKQLIRK